MNLNITETELTELSDGKRKTNSAPSIPGGGNMRVRWGAMNQYFLTDERMGLAFAYRFR